MKRLLLIVSPYFIFCLLFSVLFIIRPSKNKNKNLEHPKIDSVIVEPPVIQDEVIDSLSIQ
jgi:hypothetical protein